MARFPDVWFSNRPLIFGHRGASHEAPENTMLAFEGAVAAGADGVELDVHLTSDGVPVVIHNDRVDATTNGHGLVNDLTLDEVQRLDASAHFRSESRISGARIPTLEEVLATYGRQLLVNIELKAQSRPQAAAGLEPAVTALARRLGLEDHVWVSSFKPYSLHRMRRVMPELPCGLLYSPLSLGALWLAPFTPFEALHPHASLVWTWFVHLAHRTGKRVIVWTVDDLERAALLAQMGVDAIITNDPRRVKEAQTSRVTLVAG